MSPEKVRQSQALELDAAGEIEDSFFDHVVDNWATYEQNLPNLRRTMVIFNEFTMGARYLPENTGDNNLHALAGWELFDEEHLLKEAFGDRYEENTSILISGALTLRKPSREWLGYVERTDADDILAETSQAHYRLINEKRMEDAGIKMEEDQVDYHPGPGWYDGEKRYLGRSGIPEVWFRGFTTVKEFPEQKVFLDTIRNHPRIKLGVWLREQCFLKEKEKYMRLQEQRRHRDKIYKRTGIDKQGEEMGNLLGKDEEERKKVIEQYAERQSKLKPEDIEELSKVQTKISQIEDEGIDFDMFLEELYGKYKEAPSTPVSFQVGLDPA